MKLQERTQSRNCLWSSRRGFLWCRSVLCKLQKFFWAQAFFAQGADCEGVVALGESYTLFVA